MACPCGMNRVPTGQQSAIGPNPCFMPPTYEIPHGSPERRGSVRARSRERGGGRNSDRTMTPTARPRTPRQPAGPPPVQEEVDREDLVERIAVLENIAVTHATFLHQVYDDVGSTKQAFPQITEKVSTLDGYA